MNFRRLWHQWFGTQRKRSARGERKAWRRLRCEPLEERRLLTVNFESMPLGTNFIAPQSKDVLIPLSTTNTNNTAVTYAVQSAPGSGVTASIETAGTTLRMNVTFTDGGTNQQVTGDLFFRLFDSLTPNTVASILSSVNANYYNGKQVPRILNGFVAQFGSSNNTLSDPGGPAAFDDEFNASLTFTGPGLLAMANGGPDTNGRQMFITDVDVPAQGGAQNMPQFLNFDHTVFGQLVGGFDLFKRLMETPTGNSPFINDESSGPTNTVTVNTLSVVTDNRHAILRLHTDGAAALGNRTVTVRATSAGDNLTADQTFNLSVQTDSLNDEPFLPDLAETVTTNPGQPITITATEIDGENVTFDVVALNGSSTSAATSVTFSASGNVLTITPNSNFTGTTRLRVSVREANTNTVDDLEDFDLHVRPRVALSTNPTNGQLNENGGSTTVVATLTAAPLANVTVNLSFSGSATFNTEYSTSGLSGVAGNTASFVIPAGQTSGSFTITAINDSISEGPETTVVALGAITGGGGGVVASASTTTATIVDDEPLPQTSLSISTLTFAEKSGSATIIARITNGVTSVNPTLINLNFANGTATALADFSSFTTITIPAGQSTGSVTIFGIDDSIPELDETFTVSVGTVTNGTVSPAFSQTVTITSDEAGIQDFKLAPSSDDGGSVSDGYISKETPTFNFQAPPNEPVRFEINGSSVGSGTAGASGSGTFTVPTGQLKIGDNTIRAIVGSGASQTSSTTSITYAPKLDEGYHIGGDIGATRNVSFKFDAQQALYRSEVGVYIADDSTGRVGSLSPGQAGYAKAALERAQTLFVRGVAVGANQVIALSGGQVLGFYMVQSGTRTQALAMNPNNNPPGALGIGGPVTFFSFDAANPDGVRHVQVVGDPLTGSAEYRWEDLFGGGDMDFNDFVFSVNLAGSNATPTMETLRVPVASTVTASTTFTLQAPLAAPNTATNFSSLSGEFGLFKISSPSGTVNNLSPGDNGWVAAALATANRTSLFTNGAAVGATRSVNLSGADRFGFYRIVGGTADQLLSSNPSNNSSGSIYALVSFDPANPDDADHFRWYASENANQGITGQGTDDDDLRLHIMDQLFDNGFDAFSVKIDF